MTKKEKIISIIAFLSISSVAVIIAQSPDAAPSIKSDVQAVQPSEQGNDKVTLPAQLVPLEIGQKAETPSPPKAQEQPSYYTNTYGNEVQSPTHYDSIPEGASAHCRDGTYSFSQNRRGTCSHHGGVATWY